MLAEVLSRPFHGIQYVVDDRMDEGLRSLMVFGCQNLAARPWVSKSSVLDDLVTPLSNLETPHQSRHHCH
jgi:hypothetical protein